MVDVLYGSARLLAFAAFALLVGVAFFLSAWWPAGAHYPALRRLIWSGWGVLVTSTVAVVVLFGPQVARRPLSGVIDAGLLSATLGTQVGAAMLIRLLVLSLAAPGLALLLSRTPIPPPSQRVWRIGGVVIGAVALGVTWSIAGHSGVGRQAVIAIPADVMHLLAMGVWLGGLVVLCGVLLRTKEIAVMRTAVPSFSRAVPLCVAVLIVTGGYQSWRQVGDLTALITTSYGWLLLGKVALVMLLVGVGAASRSWVRRHYTGSAACSISARRAARYGPGQQEIARFRRMVVAEAGLAAFVLGVTAVLVSSSPARTERIEALAQQRAAQAQAATVGWVANLKDAAEVTATVSLPDSAGETAAGSTPETRAGALPRLPGDTDDRPVAADGYRPDLRGGPGTITDRRPVSASHTGPAR